MKWASKLGTDRPTNPTNGATPGTSTAHRPKPRSSNCFSMRPANASESSRLSVPTKCCMTTGSAFSRANGSRSPARHRRRSRRSVLSSKWGVANLGESAAGQPAGGWLSSLHGRRDQPTSPRDRRAPATAEQAPMVRPDAGRRHRRMPGMRRLRTAGRAGTPSRVRPGGCAGRVGGRREVKPLLEARQILRTMGRIVVFNSVTLDGVMQAPARPDEDLRGGFKHGGWALPYADAISGSMAARPSARGLLLGRRTYEDFFAVWPNRTENPFTEVLNRSQKYVASRTRREPLPWMNSTLLKGEAGNTVAQLKDELDGELVVLGSGELVQGLMQRNLVDEFVLLIHPLILGSGRRLFAEGGPAAKFRLVDTKPTTTGVIITTYERALYRAL